MPASIGALAFLVRLYRLGDKPFWMDEITSLHRATNVVFADNSVRPLSAAVSPRVLEALATVAGSEDDGQGRRGGAAGGEAAR